jgi:hypothetical protein
MTLHLVQLSVKASLTSVKKKKMSAVPLADPLTSPGSNQLRLQTLELQVGLDAQHIALLQKENQELKDALLTEQARAERHADAMVHIARICDDRSSELKAQHAAAVISHQKSVANMEDAKDVILNEAKAENATLKAEVRDLKSQVAILQAQTTSKLTDICTAIAGLHTLLPPLMPPLPPLVSLAPVAFDRDWCTAACGSTWKVEIDVATNTRAHIAQAGMLCPALRSAAPLPRWPPSLAAADGRQELPAYRIVVEAYGPNRLSQFCFLGFLPSHCKRTGGIDAATAVIPVEGRPIPSYGGWHIAVRPLSSTGVDEESYSGWTVLHPLGVKEHVPGGSSRGAPGSTSAYATTAEVPPVPPGSAVEFAVDYAAGTCRVAFYTPAAVAGGFVEAPHAKMELRFVATQAKVGSIVPARPIPTLADSGVELFPAVNTGHVDAVWRFGY